MRLAIHNGPLLVQGLDVGRVRKMSLVSAQRAARLTASQVQILLVV